MRTMRQLLAGLVVSVALATTLIAQDALRPDPDFFGLATTTQEPVIKLDESLFTLGGSETVRLPSWPSARGTELFFLAPADDLVRLYPRLCWQWQVWQETHAESRKVCVPMEALLTFLAQEGR